MCSVIKSNINSKTVNISPQFNLPSLLLAAVFLNFLNLYSILVFTQTCVFLSLGNKVPERLVLLSLRVSRTWLGWWLPWYWSQNKTVYEEDFPTEEASHLDVFRWE